MARPPRLPFVFERYAQPVWFITANTADRRPWLNDEAVHTALLHFAESGLNTGRAALGRYVLMPDHLHLFVQLAREETLSAWVKALKAVLRRASANETARWQPGFFDHLLRRCESYEEKWDYVRMNPERAGLVRQAEDWPFQGEFHPLRFD
jgi:REP element-mobilizing transposase RayT